MIGRDIEELSEGEILEMKEHFNKEVWPRMKKELKDATKKESCFLSFVAGSDMMRHVQEKRMRKVSDELTKMKPEDIEKMIEGEVGKEDEEESLWEDKTKVNGAWIDDKNEERG